MRALIILACLIASTVSGGPTAAQTQPARSRSEQHEVSVATYDLGDQAFVDPTVTNYEKPHGPVPQELTAVVHYPTDVGVGEHPLIVMVHGSWWTCVDRSVHKPRLQWPCRSGTSILKSYRGYDYLGEALARRGFVVVSISANAINAHVLGDPDYYGRAHLINEHLALWSQLVGSGSGPLLGSFVDARTRQPVAPPFAGHVDLTDVGTLGHSRGGRGVMWQAADAHRDEWPAGINIRAVLALAPVYLVMRGEPRRNQLVTEIPFEVINGACDGAVGGDTGRKYVRDVKGLNPDATWIDLKGADHNNFNTKWTPGHIGGDDDSTSPCPGKLTGHAQRAKTVRLVTRFFVRTLGPS